MARRKQKYDSACYYKGKLMGRCTVADGNAFVVLLEHCDNSAERVLREFDYFSLELKAILEKMADIQNKEKGRAKT